MDLRKRGFKFLIKKKGGTKLLKLERVKGYEERNKNKCYFRHFTSLFGVRIKMRHGARYTQSPDLCCNAPLHLLPHSSLAKSPLSTLSLSSSKHLLSPLLPLLPTTSTVHFYVWSVGAGIYIYLPFEVFLSLWSPLLMEIRLPVLGLIVILCVEGGLGAPIVYSARLVHRFSDEAKAHRDGRVVRNGGGGGGGGVGFWPERRSLEYYRRLLSSDVQRQTLKLSPQFQFLYPSEGSATLPLGNDFGW